MTTETEELLWIGSQENKFIPREIVLFGIQNKKTLFDLLTTDESEFKEITKKNLDTFLKNREKIPFEAFQRIYDNLQKDRVNLITYCDPLFPQNLKKLGEKSHPILLYHQGKKMRFENGVAMVGTRNCSTRAIEFVREVSRNLAEEGYTIVSGLARGIDSAAHRGALSVGGTTVAVLPWMHEPYPPEHEQLLNEIKKDGAVISENFFQSSRLDKYKFLQRNAIISGISEVVIAVESSFSGGTRWQVELSLSQEKKVIVMEPEKENESAYDGFEKFVQNGAIVAKNPAEAIKIVKHEVKIQDKSLDDYDTEDEIKLKPLLKN